MFVDVLTGNPLFFATFAACVRAEDLQRELKGRRNVELISQKPVASRAGS
jgi:hypothetical protein